MRSRPEFLVSTSAMRRKVSLLQPVVRSTLERFRPDVLALQEVWAGEGATQADELADRMWAVVADYPRADELPAPPADDDVVAGKKQ